MSKKRSRGARALQFWGVVFLILTSAGTVWTLWWWGLGALVPSWNEWWHGVVSLWLAFLTLLMGSLLWGKAVGDRRQTFFAPYIEVIRRIAAGDYSAQVPIDPKHQNDETPFHTLAENLNAMAGALAKVEDLRRQFVADVSHEFQSPLTSILGFAQALKTGLPEEMRLRYLGIIETEARRLSRLADTLLKLNSLEDREGPPDPAPFRLDVQLRRVLVALEPQWSAKSLEIEAVLEELELIGNEELWTQVWTNLLHNAVKFTPAGGRITVRLSKADVWTVDVEDSGIGLTGAEADRIFERFYKAEAARSHAGEGGNGLGLALVQRIVHLHGARVEALSPGPGHGTTMRVSGSPSSSSQSNFMTKTL